MMSSAIRLYTPDMQGTGAFDGGRITEQKPIGFPGEGGAVDRVGPLFYWAWAFAPQEGYIAPHPHQAFEIMTYVVNGKAEHGDSLGTRSTVGPGGAQVMLTGSGVYHEERFVGPDMEGFQIWFEPDLRQARLRQPAYYQFEHEEFPLASAGGAEVKTVIGEGSPVQLTVDARMYDIAVTPGAQYAYPLKAGRSLAALAIRGSGSIASSVESSPEQSFEAKQFAVIDAEAGLDVVLKAGADETLRLIAIEVPSRTDYPLYRKR